MILSVVPNSVKNNVDQCSSTKHFWENLQYLYVGKKHIGQDKEVDNCASNQAGPHIEESNNNDEEEA